MIKGCEVDTDSLSTDEASELESLVEQCDLSQTKSGITPDARDLLGYGMTIETDEGVYDLSFDEMTVPRNVEPLLEYLQRRAKPSPLT